MDILKSAAAGILKSTARKALLWALQLLAPVLVMALLFFFIYAMLFLIPGYIVRDSGTNERGYRGKVVAIYTMGNRDDWKLSDDQRLYEKYREIDEKWLRQFIDQETLDNSRIEQREGNAAEEDVKVREIWGRFYPEDSGIPSERSQVKQHGISWALLAAADRILGDTVITGLPGRQPDPENNFKRLEPGLKWKDFTLYYHCSWTEQVQSGKESRTKKMTKTYRHKIRLLSEVNSYEAERTTYHWVLRRHRYRDPKSDFIEEAEYPELEGVSQQGPYFEKLRSLLADHQLVKDSDLELLLHLAMSYDEEFKYHVSLISGNMTDLFVNTEKQSYYFPGEAGVYQWPLEEYRTITSGYGWRLHPVLGGLRFHKGIDIAAPSGTPVLSAWEGEVILAGWITGYGKTVIVDHGRYRTLYAHLMEIDVEPGSIVNRGERLGRVDSTGLSTGNHLHFEIRSGDGKTDYHDPIAVYNLFNAGKVEAIESIPDSGI